MKRLSDIDSESKQIFYKCDYCNKLKTKEKKILSHELICKYNPKNKDCATCKHFLIMHDVLNGGRQIECYLHSEAFIPWRTCKNWEAKK